MSYAYECPLCYKVLRPTSIFSHLVETHCYRYVLFETFSFKDSLVIAVKLSENEEPAEFLEFKKVPLKHIKMFFKEKEHYELDGWTKE